MSMIGSPGSRRYGMLRGSGTALFVLSLLTAVAMVLSFVLMLVMLSQFRYGGPPAWWYLMMVVALILSGAFLVIFGLTHKHLSVALANAGEQLEQIRSGLYRRATGAGR